MDVGNILTTAIHALLFHIRNEYFIQDYDVTCGILSMHKMNDYTKVFNDNCVRPKRAIIVKNFLEYRDSRKATGYDCIPLT